MTYGLDEFCDDCRSAIDPDTRKADLEKVRLSLEQLLENQQFVQAHCGPDAEVGTHTIYRDPEIDFMVLAHINDKGRTSPPHDHGASWAIYGQTVEHTNMTEYTRNDDGSKDGYAELEKRRSYRLDPGMAGMFGPHEVHSINFPDGARFIRITGTDLTRLPTLRYDLGDSTVTRVTPNMKGEAAGSASA